MRLNIVVDERAGAVTVPRAAVFSMDGKDYVYVAAEGRAALREVSVGIKGESRYEALFGVEEGDAVIVSPGDDVYDGVRVNATRL